MFYPIFVLYLSGERQQLCASSPSILHTFGRLEASVRLILFIIPKVEPRALLSRTDAAVHMLGTGPGVRVC